MLCTPVVLTWGVCLPREVSVISKEGGDPLGKKGISLIVFVILLTRAWSNNEKIDNAIKSNSIKWLRCLYISFKSVREFYL